MQSWYPLKEKFEVSPSCFMAAATSFKDLEGTFLLYSGGSLDSSQFSYLALFPRQKITVYKDRLLDKTGQILFKGSPWDGLKQVLHFERASQDSLPLWFGCLSYELGFYSEEQSSLTALEDPILGAFYCHQLLLRYTHQTRIVELYCQREELSDQANQWQQKLCSQSFWSTLEPLTFHILDVHITQWISQKAYCDLVTHIQEWIRAGEVYQLNLSHEIVVKASLDPFALFQTLSSNNPAPFAAFVRLSEETVICSSPERLLKFQQGKLETRPIKGTMPRGTNKEQDRFNRQQLGQSQKNCAELMMIADLMRNDLGKVSIKGSVRVIEKMRCEAYQNVFHLLSRIESIAKPQLHPVELLRACFPAGSITGCPKGRAMQLIYHIEKRKRGIYTGSIGYFAANGEFDWNVAIRTLTYCSSELSIQIGGAVVIDSVAEEEYLETLYKGQTILSALGVMP